MNDPVAFKFDAHGLIPAIVQDETTGDVLMVAYMNQEALDKTIASRKAWFFSRSRNKLWMKGESSGHTQEVRELFYDCDADAILVKVDQKGAACHEGYRSCFFRRLNPDGSSSIIADQLFDPKKVYGDKAESHSKPKPDKK